MPKSHWEVNTPSSQRYYWGWNEVPVDSLAVNSPNNWDAIVIKLPAAICGSTGGSDSIGCLQAQARQDLENQLAWYESNGYLKVGYEHIAKRPGSYVVVLREWQQSVDHWQRWFFCESWNSDKYQIVFRPQAGIFSGMCRIARAGQEDSYSIKTANLEM